MNKPSDYKALALWHFDSGSYNNYVGMLQEKAAAENAPLDALYYGSRIGRWICMGDLSIGHPFRARYAQVYPVDPGS